MDLDAYFGHKSLPADYRSGFVGIIGRPNVGKSTLMNCLLGQKVSIMSDKPQTTRNRIRGIYTTDKLQAVFLDTPGIHKPKHKLGEYMNKAADTFADADLIFYLVDATAEPGGGEDFIVQRLQAAKCPVFLVVNKIDLLPQEQVLIALTKYSALMDFAEVVPVSAAQGVNTLRLEELLEKYLPYGPQFYDPEQITDLPERELAAEIIREKLLVSTRDEIPHSLAVVVDDFREQENGVVRISATIHVERDSQKGIVIGKGGSMLKKVGQLARPEIEEAVGAKVFLDLRVKVKKDWRNSDSLLKNFGYDKKEL